MQVTPDSTKGGSGQRKITALRIKQRILEKKTSVSEIARELGYARNTVSLSIHHPTIYPAVRDRVISHLCIS